MPACALDGCDKPARSNSGQAMCKMHYHRAYRHGDVTKTARNAAISVSNGRRYPSLHRPGHPLALASGKVYEHRLVLFDEIGPGAHACHWCATAVCWEIRRGVGALQVDHLNGIGDDNRPENLVPSCGPCNTGRAIQTRADALRAHGWWAQHDTIVRLSKGGRRPRIAA